MAVTYYGEPGVPGNIARHDPATLPFGATLTVPDGYVEITEAEYNTRRDQLRDPIRQAAIAEACGLIAEGVHPAVAVRIANFALTDSDVAGCAPPAPVSVGRSATLDFVQEGDTDNEWLHNESHKARWSDKQPAVVPFDGKLDWLTFTNEQTTVHFELSVYVNGAVATTVEVVSGARVQVFDLNVPVSRADEVGVHAGPAIGGADKLQDVNVAIGVIG